MRYSHSYTGYIVTVATLLRVNLSFEYLNNTTDEIKNVWCPHRHPHPVYDSVQCFMCAHCTVSSWQREVNQLDCVILGL